MYAHCYGSARSATHTITAYWRMYIALRSFFAVPRCRVTEVALLQQRYFFGCSVALANGCKLPMWFASGSVIQRVLFFRARSARFYFCYFTRSYGGEHFAYFARFSYGGEKGIISTAYFIPTAKIHLPFRRNFQRLVRVFVQTAYISPFAFFVKYFKIISTEGLRVIS